MGISVLCFWYSVTFMVEGWLYFSFDSFINSLLNLLIIVDSGLLDWHPIIGLFHRVF